MRISKRMLKVVLFLTLMMFVTVACTTSQPAPQTPAPQTPAPADGPKPLPPLEQTKLKVGMVNCNAVCGFRFMAEEQGYFKEQGIDVEFIYGQNNVNLVRALIAGDIDILEQNVSPLLIAVGVGQTEVSIIGAMNPGLSFVLFGTDDIKVPKDLEGKTVGISTPGALPHVLVEMLIEQEGLDGSTIQYVPTGSNPQRVQALIGGHIDATPTNFDFDSIVSQHAGYHLAFPFQKYFPDYLQNAISVTKTFGEANPELLTRFLTAYMKGAQYALDHPEETAKLVAKILETDLATAQEGVATYIKNDVISPEITLRESQIQYMIDNGVKSGTIEKAYPASKVYAPQYAAEAKRRLEK